MTAGRALQVHHPGLIAQQVLPVNSAVAAAAAFGAVPAVVAVRAGQPGATATVGVGINRKHGSPPVREYSRADQLVIDPLLVVVQTAIQHAPGALFLREHLNGIPVVPNCLENGGAPTRFIERQVIRVLEIARHFRHGSATDRDYAFGPNVVRAATAGGDAGIPWMSALPCRR